MDVTHTYTAGQATNGGFYGNNGKFDIDSNNINNEKNEIISTKCQRTFKIISSYMSSSKKKFLFLKILLYFIKWIFTTATIIYDVWQSHEKLDNMILMHDICFVFLCEMCVIGFD